VTGCLYCNELLDAFPCERLRFDGAAWRRLGVGVGPDGRFEWVALAGPLPADLEAVANQIGSAVPAGFTTEVCGSLSGWARAAAGALERGRVVVLDYAREAEDYFAPHRTEGTLRGYAAHRRCDDPFAAPGETDLTADVNATHLREAAARAGFRPGPLESQERFFTRLAEARLRAMEVSGDSSSVRQRTWVRQFRTLVHPSLLGRAFSVLELARGPAASAR
jgi:SAM-dependent MidA family methyltransferase